MNQIPEFLRSKALARGIADEEIDDLWEQHVDRAALEGRDAGGRMWEKFLDAVLRDVQERVAVERKDADRVAGELERRRVERSRKQAADALYAREAVSLPDYLESLRDKAARLEPLTDAEAKLAAFRRPYPGEYPGAWMLDAVAGHGNA